MPELPEVETVVRGLRNGLTGQTIASVWHDWDKTIATPSPEELSARMAGKEIMGLSRRGKYIVCHLDEDEYFLVHLKMTGRLYIAERDQVFDADRWVHFKLLFVDGNELRFSDARKFGRVYFTDNLANVTGQLGPEPLDENFTVDEFLERLQARNKNIKALLLDQTFIAGVGNIYADEALFQAGIHPMRTSSSIIKTEAQRLFIAIQEVLQRGIDHEGASINWYRKPDGSKGSSQTRFFVYGRENQPCLRCGTLIQKIRVAQRGTHFCPSCQIVSKN